MAAKKKLSIVLLLFVIVLMGCTNKSEHPPHSDVSEIPAKIPITIKILDDQRMNHRYLINVQNNGFTSKNTASFPEIKYFNTAKKSFQLNLYKGVKYRISIVPLKKKEKSITHIKSFQDGTRLSKDLIVSKPTILTYRFK